MGLAALGLIASMPVWLAVALAVKLEDGGPIFFEQERWGRMKRRIRVLKFRSMATNSSLEDRSVQAGKHDARITRVGKLLRATALDEMPQLLNILKGEMSFVGPRALPINEVQARERDGALPDEAIPGFGLRCRVRPGLTGLAQIYAPRDVPRRHKFRYDVLYVKKQSLWLDIRLIVLSLCITACAKWESRGNG
ncbi:MAG: sugar transferase [candidate division NC10 bacterium]|nr:sugar transferase [candidate division NC10 bacterium]